MRIYPVILCGGSGTRLWPASRAARPKQFIPLVDDRSLFQQTVLRFDGFAPAPVIVAGPAHVGHIQSQLREIGAEATILVEPEGRDSAAAIAAAALWIKGCDADGLAVAVASDHHIPDAEAFRESLARAAGAGAQGSIVTFGVKPTAPSSAYGYIRPGAAIPGQPGVFAVERFIEKPDAETARGYVESGYLWNSGNFLFRAADLALELERFAPEVLTSVSRALADASHDGSVVRLGAAFSSAPRISIDYAVMEKAARAAVAPVAFAWSDLGAWDAVWSARDKDAAGNTGDAVLLADCADTLVRSRGRAVVGIGLKGVAVICEPDVVLVCDLAASQDVKGAVERLRAVRPDLAAGPAVSAPGARLMRWLETSALPLWWALGADHQRGGFHEALEQDGRSVDAPRRARVQARQIYVYAVAARMGWKGPAITAVRHGLDTFLGRYGRPDGLFHTRVGGNGVPLDEPAALYDQAFALLALAAAAEALPDQAAALEARAGAVLEALQDWRAPAGGFVENGAGEPYQSNAHMHLLEAALAWTEAGGSPRWRTLAAEIVDLALSRFVDPDRGVLREAFAANWAPAPGLAGRIVEPGHQFEWAWLLERWGRETGDGRGPEAARRLFAAGRAGVDPRRGVAVDALLDDLTIERATARLWPQTEWLKAATILGDTGAASQAAAALELYLDVPTPGLWRDRLGADGVFVEEPAPASSFYHIVGAIAATARARADASA